MDYVSGIPQAEDHAQDLMISLPQIHFTEDSDAGNLL
jgi:hypothetical protein